MPIGMIRQVNGYYCGTCADVELAKRGIDPARPGDGVRGEQEARGPVLGANAPEPAGSSLGSRLNVYA
jgi:hypothetical protein